MGILTVISRILNNLKSIKMQSINVIYEDYAFDR